MELISFSLCSLIILLFLHSFVLIVSSSLFYSSVISPLLLRSVHYHPILFNKSSFICQQQNCDSLEYNQYLSFVPLEYRICDECEVELDLYHRFGKPFSFRTIENKEYPTIPHGYGLEYLCVPYLNPHSHYRLLILVISGAREIKEREILRNRFSRFSNERIRFVFVTASNPKVNDEVRRESIAFDDILQLNHIDSYHNLTLTTFGAFQFISHFSTLSDYVMKTDSDCALNMNRILQIIDSLSPRDVYIGNCPPSTIYNTQWSAKNYVPPELVGDEKRIPAYVTGGGYVISSSIVGKMVVGLRHLRFIAHNEDVNVGKAMESIGVNCTHIPNWIARYGCGNEEECLKYPIIHKDKSDDEVKVFWSYILH